MTASAHDCPTALDLSREEAWVVHAALLASVERLVDDGEDAERALALVSTLEEDADFGCDELEYLADVLRAYLGDCAPSRDRRPAQNVLDDIETALA
jgi:hypothetical protein